MITLGTNPQSKEPYEGLPIHWLGPLHGNSGYAEEGRTLTAALQSTGVSVKMHDVAQPETADEIDEIARTLRATDYGYDPCDWVVHHRAWACHPGRPGRHIWRTMFETSSIPAEWVDASCHYEQIWVPSQFNAQTFTAAGVPSDKIRVINCPVPTGWPPVKEISPSGERLPNHDSFRFLSVMRWQQRKGWDVLIEAFLQEFGNDPDVELLIKATPFHSNDPQQMEREYNKFIKKRGLVHSNNIYILNQNLSTENLFKLYSDSNAFVLASRGEGWGRPYMEAMLMGLPTIGSKWSGNLEFMSDKNSYLVGGRVVPTSALAVDEWPFFYGHSWFEPSVQELRAIMRCVREGDLSANAFQEDIGSNLRYMFSADKIAAQMLTQLS